MSENNNVEFTFDYDETETIDRLISLEDTLERNTVHAHNIWNLSATRSYPN